MATILAAGSRRLTNIDARTVHRLVAVGSGLALTVVAAGLYTGASWATALWPWADVRMTYVFLASILAAAIAPSIWIGVTGELAALAPGALNTLLLNLMFAAVLGVRGLSHDEPKLLIAAAVNLAFVPMFIWLLRRAQAIPVKDTRPMPCVVTYMLWATCVILIVVGIPLLIQIDNIFPWGLSGWTSTMFGCIFLGAAGYFAYVARKPDWAFGAPPLVGFLAYDIVLFTAYRDFSFLRSSPNDGAGAYGSYGSYGSAAGGNDVNERSLAVYLVVLGVSALFAVFFLVISPATRLRVRSVGILLRAVPFAHRSA